MMSSRGYLLPLLVLVGASWGCGGQESVPSDPAQLEGYRQRSQVVDDAGVPLADGGRAWRRPDRATAPPCCCRRCPRAQRRVRPQPPCRDRWPMPIPTDASLGEPWPATDGGGPWPYGDAGPQPYDDAAGPWPYYDDAGPQPYYGDAGRQPYDDAAGPPYSYLDAGAHPAYGDSGTMLEGPGEFCDCPDYREPRPLEPGTGGDPVAADAGVP
jgi:hypothetical protein